MSETPDELPITTPDEGQDADEQPLEIDTAPEPEPSPLPEGFRPLDPRALRVDRIGSLIFTGIVTLVLGVVLALDLIFDWWGWIARAPVWAGVVVVVLGLLWLSVVWTRISHNATTYRVNDDGLEIRRGVMWRKVITVPRSRVQHTDVGQGPLLRKYGLGTLTVHTAATRTPSVLLQGLSYEMAMRVREDLRQTGSDDGV